MHETVSFWMEPEFWVAASTILLIVLAWRPMGKIIAGSLDQRAKIIKVQLTEAEAALAAAQAKLGELAEAQERAAAVAAQIMEQAERDAEALRMRGAEELEHALAAREKHAMDKIMQAETAAVHEIREMAVTLATTIAKMTLREHMHDQQMDAVITDTLQNLSKRQLH